MIELAKPKKINPMLHNCFVLLSRGLAMSETSRISTVIQVALLETSVWISHVLNGEGMELSLILQNNQS